MIRFRRKLHCLIIFDPEEIEQAIEFSKQEFKFNTKSKDGFTLRQQLESVWRQIGKKPKELENLITLPESCYFVWKCFSDLHNARSSNGYSLNPINYTEIKSYFYLIDIVPEEWEVSLIRRFDNEFLIAHFKEESSKSK